jgi:hypothetical protein
LGDSACLGTLFAWRAELLAFRSHQNPLAREMARLEDPSSFSTGRDAGHNFIKNIKSVRRLGSWQKAGVSLLELVQSVLGTASSAASVASIVMSVAIMICFWLWLRFCRHVDDQAIEHDQRPDPQKMIKAASRGPIRRLVRRSRPQLPSKPEKPPDISA